MTYYAVKEWEYDVDGCGGSSVHHPTRILPLAWLHLALSRLIPDLSLIHI